MHDTEATPEVGTVGYYREHPNLRLIWKTADLVETPGELLAVIPVNFAIVLLRPTGPVLRRSGIQVTQVRVRTEPGNEISSEAGDRAEDLLLCVEAVSDPVGHAQIGELVVQIGDLLKVEVHAGVSARAAF